MFTYFNCNSTFCQIVHCVIEVKIINTFECVCSYYHDGYNVIYSIEITTTGTHESLMGICCSLTINTFLQIHLINKLDKCICTTCHDPLNTTSIPVPTNKFFKILREFWSVGFRISWKSQGKHSSVLVQCNVFRHVSCIYWCN